MQSRPLFEESQFFLRSITQSFHLVNTARAAIIHLGDSVQKIIDAGLDDRVIGALYPTPEGTTGQNLRVLTSRDFDDTEKELAHMWLAATFAHYESWAQGVEARTGIHGFEKAVQFPKEYASRLCSLPRSKHLSAAYAGHVIRDKLCLGSRQRITHALSLYRYYKEIRNCTMHSGGLASSRLQDAATEAVIPHSSLVARAGWRGQPISLISEGEQVSVDLPLVRDAIALLQRLVFSIDGMLMISTHGEDEVDRRWTSEYGTSPVRVERAPSAPWLADRVGKRLDMPNPVDPASRGGTLWPRVQREEYVQFLEARGLLRIAR